MDLYTNVIVSVQEWPPNCVESRHLKKCILFVLQAEHNTKANTELDNEWWPKIKVAYIL